MLPDVQSCQNESYAVPPGWELAAPGVLAHGAIASRAWQTLCVVLSDGSSHVTRATQPCGGEQLRVDSTGAELGYAAVECDRRVLIQQPAQSAHALPPAVVRAFPHPSMQW